MTTGACVASCLTNFGALGHNFGIPNQFRCLKLLYSRSAGLKIGEYAQNEDPITNSYKIIKKISFFVSNWDTSLNP
jgi:hypothetical protein